jgi:hypothetical protein
MGDYFTKHHSPIHHERIHHHYLHSVANLMTRHNLMLPELQGCVNICPCTFFRPGQSHTMIRCTIRLHTHTRDRTRQLRCTSTDWAHQLRCTSTDWAKQFGCISTSTISTVPKTSYSVFFPRESPCQYQLEYYSWKIAL